MPSSLVSSRLPALRERTWLSTVVSVLSRYGVKSMVEALPVMLMMLVVGLRLIACSSVLSSRLDRLTLLPSAISSVVVPAVQVSVWSSGMVVSSRRSLRSTVVSALSPLLRAVSYTHLTLPTNREV